MSFQFTGTDQADLLSTALTQSIGDNIAITATSEAVAEGLGDKDTIVLGKDVSDFTVAGGTGNDTISVTASAATSDVWGNRGDDTINVSGDLTSTAVKGGKNNDTIFLSGALSSASLFGGSGNDSFSFNGTTETIADSIFQSGSGNNNFNISSQDFDDSTVNGGSGYDIIAVTATSGATNAYIQASKGKDTITLTADTTTGFVAGGSGADSVTVVGAFETSSMFGGLGSDTLTLTLGSEETDHSLIQDGSGNNIITVSASSDIETLSVFGGEGNDTLTGGAGADVFIVDGSADQTVKITDLGNGNDKINIYGTATVNATVDTAIGFTLEQGNNDGTINVTITDKLLKDEVAVFQAHKNGYTIDATANNNNIGITGTGVGDTIKSGSGADTITGGFGVDSITLGSGADQLVLTGDGAQTVGDNISGFGSTDVFAADISALETPKAVDGIETLDLVDADGTAVVAGDKIVVQDVAGATTLTQTANVLNYTEKKVADAAALEIALERDGGILTTEKDSGLDENHSFLIVYQDSDTDKYNLALVSVEDKHFANNTKIDSVEVTDLARTDYSSAIAAANITFI